MDYRNIRKSKGWIYNTILPFLHLEYRMLFRKIYVHNKKGVPSNKPVLIASNHPTAFIDPILLCMFFDPPVYNMTRGDIFRKPFFRKLMEHCNMFPVYRQRDGYGHERRDRNDEVFDFCREKLVEGVAVNIFVEGEHHLDKRVLTMQKGIARIAFGTYEQHKLEDLQIIPVGCNYVAGDELRDEAKLIVGEPLFIKDYWDRYQLNPGATITALCADIKKALISICYNIDDKEDDVLVEQLLTLWRNDHPGVMVPVVETGNSRFLEEKAVIAKVNAMPATEKDVLKEKSTAYFSALGQEGISDEALSRPKQGNLIWIGFFILGLIPALAGYLLSWPIREFAQYITRTKVKKREFRTSIIMGVGTVGAFFYYIIMFIVGLFLGWPFLITLALMLPILTWFSIFWTERFRHWVAARNAKSHPRRQMLLDLRGKVTY